MSKIGTIAGIVLLAIIFLMITQNALTDPLKQERSGLAAALKGIPQETTVPEIPAPPFDQWHKTIMGKQQLWAFLIPPPPRRPPAAPAQTNRQENFRPSDRGQANPCSDRQKEDQNFFHGKSERGICFCRRKSGRVRFGEFRQVRRYFHLFHPGNERNTKDGRARTISGPSEKPVLYVLALSPHASLESL